MHVTGRSRKRRKLKSEINVVPYIDVMLVLLIIFMVTAPLMNLGVDIQLPQSAAKAIQNDKERSFGAAWYLPAGVDRLLLTMNVPSEGQPLRLTVPLPASATDAANASGE